MPRFKKSTFFFICSLLFISICVNLFFILPINFTGKTTKNTSNPNPEVNLDIQDYETISLNNLSKIATIFENIMNEFENQNIEEMIDEIQVAIKTINEAENIKCPLRYNEIHTKTYLNMINNYKNAINDINKLNLLDLNRYERDLLMIGLKNTTVVSKTNKYLWEAIITSQNTYSIL